jgi:hypothetical protein
MLDMAIRNKQSSIVRIHDEINRFRQILNDIARERPDNEASQSQNNNDNIRRVHIVRNNNND